MSNLFQNANFNIECDCTKLWTNEVFEDVPADRHRTSYEIETSVTYGCLKQSLSWSHSKKARHKRVYGKKSRCSGRSNHCNLKSMGNCMEIL